MSNDRRAAERKKRFVFGAVQRPDGREILCAVRDASAMGAQIEVLNAREVPDQFSLKMDGTPHARDCVVAWRSATKVGVAFLPRPLVIDA